MSIATTTRIGRKIRGDSKLDQLNPAQREQLHHWLEEENCTYATVAFRLQHNLGITVGQSAIFAYYHRHIAPDRHDDDVDAAAAFTALQPGDFDAATLTKAKALAFTSLARPQPLVKTAARLLDLVYRVKKQEIAEKRLALEERRVALREALAAHPPQKPRRARAASGPAPQPAPPAPPSSQKSPPDSPLFSGSCGVSRPSTPPPSPPSPLAATSAPYLCSSVPSVAENPPHPTHLCVHIPEPPPLASPCAAPLI